MPNYIKKKNLPHDEFKPPSEKKVEEENPQKRKNKEKKVK